MTPAGVVWNVAPLREMKNVIREGRTLARWRKRSTTWHEVQNFRRFRVILHGYKATYVWRSWKIGFYVAAGDSVIMNYCHSGVCINEETFDQFNLASDQQVVSYDSWKNLLLPYESLHRFLRKVTSLPQRAKRQSSLVPRHVESPVAWRLDINGDQGTHRFSSRSHHMAFALTTREIGFSTILTSFLRG